MCGVCVQYDYTCTCTFTPVPGLDERTQHFTKEITLGRITKKTIKDFGTKINPEVGHKFKGTCKQYLMWKPSWIHCTFCAFLWPAILVS